ncbi:MAG: amidase [Gammaproteobacteria bacterium]|nr:amidase [Gammaproteobacteria bacterium]
MTAADDGIAMAKRVRDGERTAVELVDSAIKRAKNANATLNAIIEPAYEAAYAAAEAGVDTLSASPSPLAGVPTLLKDLLTPASGETAYQGNRVLRERDHRYAQTGAVARRLAQAGMVSLGRTHSPEFGCGNCTAASETELYGSTRNPWDPALTPMGSSGGTAAAVASGIVPIAQASDGGGSIRMPASACGIVGLKPSRGRVSNAPAGEVWAGGCTQGVLARTVRDAAAGLDILSGPELGDPYANAIHETLYSQLGATPTPLRIGVCPQLPFVDTAPACLDAVQDAADLLAQLGHQVERSHPAALDSVDYLYDYITIIRVSLAAELENLGPVIGRPWQADDMEDGSWVNYSRGRKVGAMDYANAREKLHTWTREVLQWWAAGHDVLLMPTLAGPPPQLGYLVSGNERERTERLAATIPFTPQFNVTGQPAISMPLHWTEQGVPIGVQLIAAPGRDDLLVRLAAQLERARPWAWRTPQIWTMD